MAQAVIGAMCPQAKGAWALEAGGGRKSPSLDPL